jgi:Na+/melibiose symporter-like transporter
VPLLGTLTVPLLASRMKKRHVYLVASAINLVGMGMMMAAGVNSWGLVAGAVVLSLGAGQRTAIYPCRPIRWITGCGKPASIPPAF